MHLETFGLSQVFPVGLGINCSVVGLIATIKDRSLLVVPKVV